MAPWFETKTIRLFEIPVKTTVSELKVGQSVKLDRGNTSMGVEIISEDKANVSVLHRHLKADTWTVNEDGSRQFEKHLIPPLAHTEIVERTSIVLENGNVTSVIDWRPKTEIPNKGGMGLARIGGTTSRPL